MYILNSHQFIKEQEDDNHGKDNNGNNDNREEKDKNIYIYFHAQYKPTLFIYIF